MNQLSDVSTFDITGRAPLVSGQPILGDAAHRALTSIVDTRFHFEARAGRILRMRLNDDLSVVINDGLWCESSPFEAVVGGDDRYVLSLRLAGDCLESVNGNTHVLGASTCSMIRYAPQVKHVFRLVSDEPLVEVCVVFGGKTAGEVESLLAPSRQDHSNPAFNQCRMTPAIEAVVRRLRAVCLFGKTWRLFAEGNALELIALYLEQLERESAAQPRSPLSLNDVQRLHFVRDYLGRRYKDSPRIEELCRLAGLNRRKLTEGFKAEFGRTVGEYIQGLRMEQARALFQDGLTEIGQVARRVGYGHQSNFTKAFKDHHGMAPRQFLLGGAGVRRLIKCRSHKSRAGRIKAVR